MDLIKIGKYIAGKRKELGLTQSQLAEKLGKSDKSVSKWERGICLPDVSVYLELCGILGISINEFLAGEDIGEESVVRKSEDNLIQVTKDSKHKQKNLKAIIAVLLVITMAAVTSLWLVVSHNSGRPRNYITAFDRDSTEMRTAELLSGADGAFLFKYDTKDEFETLVVYVSEYRSGELIAKNEVAEFTYDEIGSPTEGMIAILPDFESFSVKLILTDSGIKYSTAIPILEGAENRSHYARSATQVEQETPIRFDGSEQGLAALIYGKNRIRTISIQELEKGITRAENDYVYYFSFQFGK